MGSQNTKSQSRCFVTQPGHQAGRSVKPLPCGRLRPGVPGRGMHVHLHTETHTHSRRGVGPKTFKTGKNLKQNAEEPFTGHVLWLLASNFAFCTHPRLSSSWWTAEWPVHGHRVHDRALRASPEPHVLMWAAPSGLHWGRPVTLTQTRPTTRARKKCCCQF